MSSLPERVLSALIAGLGRVASPSGPRARLNILVYHRVAEEGPTAGADGVPRADFDRQMAVLASCFNVIPLSDAVAGLERGALPERATCITFDDGYADNATVALPVLQRHGLHATFFVAAGFVDGGIMFNDVVIEAVRRCPLAALDLTPLGLAAYPLSDRVERRAAIDAILEHVKYLRPGERESWLAVLAERAGVALPRDLMMTSAQVRALADAGMEVGGHTVSHPILSRLDDDDARREIAEGRDRLQAITGRTVTLFAYPNGKPGRDYELRHARMVHELGFRAAVCTAWGSASVSSDRFQLPRFTPWDTRTERFALRLAGNWWRRQEERAGPRPAQAVSG